MLSRTQAVPPLAPGAVEAQITSASTTTADEQSVISHPATNFQSSTSGTGVLGTDSYVPDPPRNKQCHQCYKVSDNALTYHNKLEPIVWRCVTCHFNIQLLIKSVPYPFTPVPDYHISYNPIGDLTTISNNLMINGTSGIAISGSGSGVAIGNNSTISTMSTAVGVNCNVNNPGLYSTSIGYACGETNCGNNSVNIGRETGMSSGLRSINIGSLSGGLNAGIYSINMGHFAGYNNCGDHSINLGRANKGLTGINAPNNTICLNATGINIDSTVESSTIIAPIRDNKPTSHKLLGYDLTTSEVVQSNAFDIVCNSVIINDKLYCHGLEGIVISGNNSAGDQTGVAIGNSSKNGHDTTAIGQFCHYSNPQNYATTIGSYSGTDYAGKASVNIGRQGGRFFSGDYSTNIGNVAGYRLAGQYSVNIGDFSGVYSSGVHSINIGRSNKGIDGINAPNNTICLNATGTNIDSTVASSTIIAPIRDNKPTNHKLLGYNLTTSEVVQSNSFDIVCNSVNGITATEINCLDNISSNIQSQLNNINTNITAGISYNPTGDLTTISNNLNVVGNINDITPTEINCLDNISSNIQSQLNNINTNITAGISYNPIGDLTTISNNLNVVGNINDITPTEINCLDNISSNIQSQLNNIHTNITAGISYNPTGDLTTIDNDVVCNDLNASNIDCTDIDCTNAITCSNLTTTDSIGIHMNGQIIIDSDDTYGRVQIGNSCGSTSNCVSVGKQSAENIDSTSVYCVNVGTASGKDISGINCQGNTNLGAFAGRSYTTPSTSYSTNIGYKSGDNKTQNNTITINASSTGLIPYETDAFYVSNMRDTVPVNPYKLMAYDSTLKEIVVNDAYDISLNSVQVDTITASSASATVNLYNNLNNGNINVGSSNTTAFINGLHHTPKITNIDTGTIGNIHPYDGFVCFTGSGDPLSKYMLYETNTIGRILEFSKELRKEAILIYANFGVKFCRKNAIDTEKQNSIEFPAGQTYMKLISLYNDNVWYVIDTEEVKAGAKMVNDAGNGVYSSWEIYKSIANFSDMYPSSGSVDIGGFHATNNEDEDDFYIVAPRYRLVVYDSRNYASVNGSGIQLDYTNTSLTWKSVKPVNGRRVSSCKLYYNGIEIT